jgi:hypothetical protein
VSELKKIKTDASRFYQLPRQNKFEFATFPSFLSKILAPKRIRFLVFSSISILSPSLYSFSVKLQNDQICQLQNNTAGSNKEGKLSKSPKPDLVFLALPFFAVAKQPSGHRRSFL